MNNLEQIAKQVSLLNRLIELLRMQEEPSPLYLLSFYSRAELDRRGWSFEEAWNHPVTQKAWADELVKVAKDLELSTGAMENPDDRDNFGEDSLKDKSIEYLFKGLLKYIDNGFTVHMILRGILNKYGRSLSE